MNIKGSMIFCFAAIVLLITNLTAPVVATQSSALENPGRSYIIEDETPYFQSIKGCAVFFSEKENVYHLYNQELAELETSPDSTFKILSCLMGLESGVIDPDHSSLLWDGFVYPIAAWNRSLDYRQAFRSSAIWYYRRVLDETGRDFVQKILDRLSYGNRDISQWEGGSNLFFPEIKDEKSINGFWQESSLKISPMNQVDVLYKIFHEMDGFDPGNIGLLKDTMLQDAGISGLGLYGKTGTGVKDEAWTTAWFVGFYEYNGDTVYFAVRENEPGATGQDAREIAMKIIGDMLHD